MLALLRDASMAPGDNLSLSFAAPSSLQEIANLIDTLEPDTVRPLPSPDAAENLKFSECLPPEIVAEVFTSRFDDRTGVAQTVREHRRVVVGG